MKSLQILSQNLKQQGLSQAEYSKIILDIQDEMLKLEQVDLPIVSQFCDKTYMRTIFMPAGTVVIGKTHKTEHFNIIHTGSAFVMMNGETKLIQAPDMFVSKAGVKKVLKILTDMTWSTVHVIKKRDIVKNNGIIDVDQTVNKLEKKLVLSFDEERQQIESDYKRSKCLGQQ